MEVGKRILTRRDLLKEYGITPKRLKHYVQNGLRPIREGSKWNYDRIELENVIDRMKVGS